MGTRGTIQIKDGKTKLVTIYKQYDSYVDGLGFELLDLLKGRELVNGFGFNMTTDTNFNGMGDLSAYVIKELKEEAMKQRDYKKDKNGKSRFKVVGKKGLGNVYVTGHNEFKQHEYNYLIYTKNGKIFMRCYDWNGKTLFDNEVNKLARQKIKLKDL